MVADRIHHVCLSPMKAEQADILPGSLEFSAEIYHGGNSGKHADALVFQYLKQAFRTAEKSRVSGLQQHRPAVFRMTVQKLPDRFRLIRVKIRFVSRSPKLFRGSFQHSSRADQHIRLTDGFLHFHSHILRISHTDPGNGNLLSDLQSITFCQQCTQLRFTFSRLCERPSDDKNTRARLSCRLHFFIKTAVLSGFLGHKNFCPGLPEHGKIHFQGKGTLRGDQMTSVKPEFRAVCHHRRRRKHPCKDPFPVIRDFCKCRQFFASRRHKGTFAGSFQPFHRIRQRVNEDTVLSDLPGRAKQAQIFCFRPFTGVSDVFRNQHRIGMGCVDHKADLFFLNQPYHLIRVQPFAAHIQILSRKDLAFPVFRRSAYNRRKPVAIQELSHMTALRRSCKQKDLIHNDIPSASPSCR